jgi:signal transduction histidine kinase
MKKKFVSLLFGMMICCATASAFQQSELHKKAEEAAQNGTVPASRSYYLRAFEDYAAKEEMEQAVDCAVKGAQLYYKENLYKEAFDLLRRADQAIAASKLEAQQKAALQYQTTKERVAMYTKIRKSDLALAQLSTLSTLATSANDQQLKNDLLYQQAICYYTFGMNAKGDAAFKQMTATLTASKEYDKVDHAFQTLIDNGRRSGSLNLVAQAYGSYIAWKDSANALKQADMAAALQQRIDSLQTTIDDKDATLDTRMAVILSLGVLSIALAIVLLVCGIVLLRYILLSRKQKKSISQLTESDSLKARFIGNIAGQLTPTLKRLDAQKPEVKALVKFAENVQTLSQLDTPSNETPEKQDVQVPQLCEHLVEQACSKARKDVTTTIDAQKMSVRMERHTVEHILAHLLKSAAKHTPEGGKITLEFKKRSARKYQFLVANTGETIPEDKREDVFKPFLETHDLTEGDGLGLPICKKMAEKMGGDLEIDPSYTKGTRFVLTLYA